MFLRRQLIFTWISKEQDEDVPTDDYDARLRACRQIVARQGQSGFRAARFDAYQGRCAVTGCDTPWVLEAAHLRPYRGPGSNTVSNGLLLRSDLHTLLDLRLLAVEPQGRTIVLSKLLAGTDYEPLSGQKVTDPAARSQRLSGPAAAKAPHAGLHSQDKRSDPRRTPISSPEGNYRPRKSALATGWPGYCPRGIAARVVGASSDMAAPL